MGVDWKTRTTLEPALDLAMVAPPEDPASLETYNVWLADGELRIGLHVYLFQMRGGTTQERALLFLPDGRTLSMVSEGRFDRADEPGGTALRFRCIEPYRRWTYSWHSDAQVTSQAEEERGWVQDKDCPTARVEVEIDATTVAEPWTIPLSTGPLNLAGPGQFSSDVMLGKYEQLLTGSGTIRVDGEQWSFSGMGLRGHVRGPRDTTGMGSHAWLCGYFPKSDRGFCLKQLFTLEGEPYFSEAYIARNGTIERVGIVQSPPLARDPSQHGLKTTLMAANGPIEIIGENFHTSWVPLSSWGGGPSGGGGIFAVGHGFVSEAKKLMSQSCTRYLWDGEEGFGMAELSG